MDELSHWCPERVELHATVFVVASWDGPNAMSREHPALHPGANDPLRMGLDDRHDLSAILERWFG